MTPGTIRIGISGWTYPPWRGEFYPKKLRQQDELHYAASQFPTIEINGTFYSLQRPESFARWRDGTPSDFVFSIKAPRFITHTRRLRDVATPIANFLASGVLRLGPKLGPILWQFPPSLALNIDLFEEFFALLPHDTKTAVAIAQQHDARLNGRAWLETEARRPLRHAIEIRHESFRNPDFPALLRKHNIALVVADTNKWPRLMELTTDFMYCRLHGPEELYASGYDDKALTFWRRNIDYWAAGGRDVFVYFDNDLKVLAPRDAKALGEK